tara:strand:+ start:338 stop:1186 length:849 start_codon:yes stop_codon:yes gene_type:complete
MTRLVTFGCSWTFGIGVGYEEGMNIVDYVKVRKDVDIANEHSFRGLLSKEFDLTNVNYSRGGSSNQRQFREADEFEFQEGDIVLWGITSTARNEVWHARKNVYKSFFYNHAGTCDENASETYIENDTTGDISTFSVKKGPMDGDLCRYTKIVVKHFYSHREEVRRLYHKIKHWNDYFKLKGVKIVWFDTLNHHKYEKNPDNMLYSDENYRDLLSRLSRNNGFNNLTDKYHFSWSKGFNDCGRINYLVGKKLVNPHSGHPTKEGHKQIAGMLKPYVKSCLEMS